MAPLSALLHKLSCMYEIRRPLLAVRGPNLTRKDLFFKHRELGLSSYRFYEPGLLSARPYQASSQVINPFLFNDTADVPEIGRMARRHSLPSTYDGFFFDEFMPYSVSIDKHASYPYRKVV